MPVPELSIPSGAVLFDRLMSTPPGDRESFIDRLLGIAPPPADVDLPHGAVPYLPCGVDDILASVLEAPIKRDDVLVDLGSGLGRIVFLVHLLTGARACGIELQEPLVRMARASCRRLGLVDNVSFVHANAADVELDGSVFLLYAPCNGAMLTRVLERIEVVARRRSIIVCAVDLHLDVRWLRPRSTSSLALTLYDS